VRLSADVRVGLGELALDARLDVGREAVALVGPNGAGKSTLLRAIAGLQPVDDGRVLLGGRTLLDTGARIDVPARDRRLGVVFQDHLLFDNLSALENVAFGLRARGMRARPARERAGQWLERVGLGGAARARPRELSGGQAQRVALARALASEPDALLLDEPLAALDVEARAAARRLLREHLADFAGPVVLVTHDPIEAATLAARLVVLEAGRVRQTGTVAELTAAPRSPWVARLSGVNLYRGMGDGRGIDLPTGARLHVAEPAEGPVFAAVPPSAVALFAEEPRGTPRNVWPARVEGLEGDGDRVRVRLGEPLPVVAEITPAAAAALSVEVGVSLWVAVKATEVRVYPA
jgi:molybdate transport system ATP-binding protein